MDIYIDITYGYFGVGWVYRGEFFRGTLFERAVIHSVDFLLKVYLLRLGYGPSRVLSVVFLFLRMVFFCYVLGDVILLLGHVLAFLLGFLEVGLDYFFVSLRLEFYQRVVFGTRFVEFALVLEGVEVFGFMLFFLGVVL